MNVFIRKGAEGAMCDLDAPPIHGQAPSHPLEQPSPQEEETKLGCTTVQDLSASTSTPVDNRITCWDSPTDPANPQNWSATRKWSLVMMDSAITFCQAMSSTMFAPAVPQAMVDLNCDNAVVAQLLVSIYAVGLAVGPLVLAPLSEHYGRSPIMHATNASFTIAAIICAASVNVPMILIFRLIMGISTISLGGAYVADLMKPEDRGRAMNWWNVGPVLAPIIGPIAGGYLALVTSWRWTYGLVAIAGASWLFVCFILLPETYTPRLLELKAARLAKASGLNPLPPSYPHDRRRTLLASLTRPWTMLLSCPGIVCISLFGAVAYSYMYFMFATFAEVFEMTYQFTTGEAGIAYIGLGIGSLAAQVAISIFASWQTRQRGVDTQDLEPEQHLPLLVTAGTFISAGHLCYGWSLRYQLHWALPIFGTGLSGFGIVLVFQAVQAYLVDAYTRYAASAIALSVAIRCVFGLTLPLAGPRLYSQLGSGWGNTLLAMVALGMIPLSLVLLRYSATLRNRSYYTLNSTRDAIQSQHASARESV